MGYLPPPIAVIDARRQMPGNRARQCRTPAMSRFDALGLAWPGRTTPPTETSRMNFDKEFDASGLACPLPIVKTKKALNDMSSGQVLRVVSTDPGSVCDMAAFAEQTGNQLLEQSTENKKFVFFLKKA
jgi:tRNA 2-thiouridine synthesizing protein A